MARVARVINPNNALKGGESPRKNKLKGTVRGPFIYEKKFSDRYANIKDAQGRSWQKVYHDLALYDSNKQHRVADFPVSTAGAIRIGNEWEVAKASIPAGAFQAIRAPETPSSRFKTSKPSRSFAEEIRKRARESDEDFEM